MSARITASGRVLVNIKTVEWNSAVGYRNKAEIKYWSPRYKKTVTVPIGYWSDGATFAEDIYSDGWWVHDVLCDRGTFDDGTPCTNWQASMILGDILRAEGRHVRAFYWPFATWLVGGGKCRDNGMLWLLVFIIVLALAAPVWAQKIAGPLGKQIKSIGGDAIISTHGSYVEHK